MLPNISLILELTELGCSPMKLILNASLRAPVVREHLSSQIISIPAFSHFSIVSTDRRSLDQGCISNGPWSHSPFNSLIAGFTVVDKPEAPPIAARSAQVDPFPQLSSHISKNAFETKAGKLRADFGRPKGHPAAEEVFSNAANSEKISLPERKGTRVRGKNRWQPLKF